MASTGLVAVWFTLRFLGLLVIKNLVVPNGPYLIEDIFGLLGLALTANLTFTLWKTFADIESPKPGDALASETIIQRLIDAGIQATVIGLITFAPRYADQILLGKIGGSEHYFMIFGAIVFAVIALVYARGEIREELSA